MGNASNWMDDWMQSQQQYWQAWADLAQRGMKAPETPKNPMAEGLNQWWQAVSPMTPPAGREVFDKLLEVSRGYFTLVERFMADAQSNRSGQESVDGWLDAMGKMWQEWMQGGAAFRPDAQFKGLTTFWDLPMDTWNRLAANVMPMPGDFTQAFHPEGANPVRDQLNRFLAIPAVGYTRESQEQFQILAQRQMDYAAAMQAYQMAFGKLGMDTTKAFQQSLQERGRQGQAITSLRDLYDQWVEMSEASYAEFVMTEEYQSLYGRLVNTLMALKHQLARMVDQTLEAMHMPSHAEISTLQCRQQELRRENLRLRKEMRAMRDQIEAVRRSLPQSGRVTGQDAAPPPRPAARPTAKKAAPAAAKPAAPASRAAPAKAVGKKTAPGKTAAAKKTR